ncbi:MAG: GNAT family N-acetyltransferase [Pseudomonadota bacterium]
MAEPTLRTMTREDVALATGLAADEGWNPGLSDAGCFHAADSDGFFAAEVDGRIVATLSAVRYDDGFGFVGLYIVNPEFRGRGYGMTLWRHGLARLDGCVTGLDAVPAQVATYRKSGFVPAYRSARMAGLGGGPMPGGVVRLDAVPFADVARYDRLCFPAGREPFLQAWLSAPGVSALGVMDGGILAGYGVIRPCVSGHKIGPLFANDQRVAGTLLSALAAAVPGQTFFLDVIEPNPAAVELARSRDMTEVFTTMRMYRGGQPTTNTNRIFGVTTFDLG